jgi:hypothetical protein
MKKLLARSRGPLAIVALAAAAAMCIVPAAHAAAHSTAASSAPCNLRYTISSCQSTDPTVTVSTYASGGSGGTVDCIFVWDFNWGDGNTTHATLTDPADGWKVTAQHIYAKPQTYTMAATGVAEGANCTLTPFVVTFTLLPAQPAPRFSPAVHWNRTSGRPGTLVTLTGKGWDPGGTVQAHSSSKGFFVGISSWTVNSSGGWKHYFSVGDAAPGQYKLTFTESSGHLKATGSFKIAVPQSTVGRFLAWLNACVEGQLQFDQTCQEEAYVLAHLKLDATTVLHCAEDLDSKLGIAVCVAELGASVAYGVYQIWQWWWTHKKPGP